MKKPFSLIFYVVGMAFIMLSSCTSTSKLKDGDTAFAQKSYLIAANLYQSEFNEEEIPRLKAEKAFKAAESYRLTNKTEEAEKWYEKSLDLGYDAIARYNYGLMLKANEHYDMAIRQFTQYAKEEPFNKQKAFDQIKACNQASKWAGEPNNVAVVNLDKINSSASEFGPVLYMNGDLLFTSDRAEATGEDIFGWTGERYTDIFLSRKTGDNNYGSVSNFSSVLNSGVNEGTPSFSKDFGEVYFVRCGSQGKADDYCGIYRSEVWITGEWSAPEKVSLFGDTINTGHPCLTADGKRLLFSAEAPGGYGGKDLYVSQKTYEGWSEPKNLGSEINTEGDEMFPWLDAEGTLYFSSNGHPGMGGLDIFKAKQEGDIWKEVENMKTPINSGADDFSMVLDKIKPANNNDPVRFSGFFASAREGGKGADDLYRFVLSNDNLFRLDGIVLEKIFEDPKDPNSKVIDFQPVAEAKLSLKKYAAGLQLADTALANKYGKFSFNLDGNTNYYLLANKEDYLSKSLDLSTKGLRDLKNTLITIEVRVILDRIYEEREIVLENIYYDFNKTTLRDESKVVLDTLVNMLEENPKIIVEIGSHTDSRGTDNYNIELSQGRAESVVRYLVETGINPGRLKAKGYGETRLVNRCTDGVECTEEEHQENRRTTFKVLAEKFVLESVKPENIKTDPKPDKK